jgi:vitamin B12 transporter
MRSSSSSLAVLFSSLGLILLPSTGSAQQPTALPGVYVESATIAARPVQPPAPAADQPAKGQQVDLADTPAGMPLDKVGSSVTVVTGQDLQRQQIESAQDALRGLPGVTVSQQGTPGNLAVVRIRGAESRHTLVVIDGVEVNSGTDGIFDFSNLSAAEIERIEVLRGPQSGLYGNSAIGGVINITTKSGQGPLTLKLQTEAGTQGTSSVTAQLSGGNKLAWGSLVVHGFNTSGFNVSSRGDEDDATRIQSFAARGGFALSENFKIEATAREHTTRAGYDEGFAQLYKGFFAPADAPFVGTALLRVGSVQATLDTLDKMWTHAFYVHGAETSREDVTTNVLNTTSTNYKLGYKSTLQIDGAGLPFRHFVTGMVERRFETFEQPTFSKTEFARERNTVAGEIRGEYFKSLFLAATVRHDQNDTTEDFTTWHASASYLVPGNVFRVHSSIGTGVKYPSFGDQFGFFFGFVANPNLRPEESKGYDFGIETKLFGGRAVVDVTYFHADLINEIAISCPLFICTTFNRAGLSTRDGIEIAARFAVTPAITLGGAYTYLDAREDTGLEEVRRPPHSGRIDFNYAFMQGRGNFNVAAIYNGAMKDLVTDAGFVDQRTTLDPYWLIRAAASYKLQPGVEVYGRVENVLDQHYQEVFGYNATPGMAAFAGVRLTFGGPDGVNGTWATK